MSDEFETGLAARLRRQRGVVSREQALDAGLSSSTVHRRVRSGAWERILPGVYRVGPVVDPLFWAAAAMLAVGPGARLSHASAARLWGWLRGNPTGTPDDPIDVSVARAVQGRRGARRGIRLHRVRGLDPDECAVVSGIPVTGALRTLVDAAADLGPRDVDRIVTQALRANHVDGETLARSIARYRGRPGVSAIRAVVGREAGTALTRSEAEVRFLDLVRAAGLPIPDVNRSVGPWEVDFAWLRHRVVVEVDGFRYHASRSGFERDRRKDAWFHARGFAVIRLTWRQITAEAVRTAVQVGQALARAGPG